MLQSAEDAQRVMREGQPVLGRGWKEVETFDDLEDLDEYESDEEEVYVVMDLGNGITNKALLAENSYQLVGLDTPLPFLKLGNQVFQGETVELIGDEIIFGRIRNEEDPHAPDRPPWHSTSLHLNFRPVAPARTAPARPPPPASRPSGAFDPAATPLAQPPSSFVYPRAPPVRASSRPDVATSGPAKPSAGNGGQAGGKRKAGRPKGSQNKVWPAGDIPNLDSLLGKESNGSSSGPPGQTATADQQHPTEPGPASPIDTMEQDLAKASIAADTTEAGPSQPRASPRSSAHASLHEPGATGGDDLESAEAVYLATSGQLEAAGGGLPLRKSHGRYVLATPFDLSILDLSAYPQTARFVMSEEVEKFLNPVTTEAHARDIATRGYTPKEIGQLIAGRPMRGQGSRLPRASAGRRKSKGKEPDPASKAVEEDVEMAEEGQRAEGSGADRTG